MDAGVGLGFDINQSPVRGLKGDYGVLPPLIAEQDKGTPQTLGLSVVIHIGGEVATLIVIEDKLIPAGGVLENKVPELLEGGVFECSNLAALAAYGSGSLHRDMCC